MAELDAKLVPTIILSILFWTPVQLVNFRYIKNQKVAVSPKCSFFITI